MTQLFHLDPSRQCLRPQAPARRARLCRPARKQPGARWRRTMPGCRSRFSLGGGRGGCRSWWSEPGWSGLRVARAAALAGHEVIVAEAAPPHRHRRVLAQQRGHPCRPLLSDRLEARLSLPARPADAVRLLRLARRAASQVRQAGRRDQRERGAAARRRCSRRPRSTASKASSIIDGAVAQAPRARALLPASPCARRKPASSTATRYMLALRGDLEDRGGVIAFNTPIERLRAGARAAGRSVSAAADRSGSIASMRWSIAAGLGAQRVGARDRRLSAAERVPRLVLAKGNYFSFAGRPAFSRLIYPVPVPGRARRACDARPRRAHAVRA